MSSLTDSNCRVLLFCKKERSFNEEIPAAEAQKKSFVKCCRLQAVATFYSWNQNRIKLIGNNNKILFIDAEEKFHANRLTYMTKNYNILILHFDMIIRAEKYYWCHEKAKKNPSFVNQFADL